MKAMVSPMAIVSTAMAFVSPFQSCDSATQNQGFPAVSPETPTHPMPQCPETFVNRGFLLDKILILSSKVEEAHYGSHEHERPGEGIDP